MTKGLFWRVVIGFWISVIVSVLLVKILLAEPGETNAGFVWAVISRLLVFLIVSGAVMLFITRSVMHPMIWLKSTLRRFESGELGARVDSKVTGLKSTAEMEGLIGDFNRMANRVEELVRSQRQLLADVSHELRSPLARLSLAVDLLREFPEDREEYLARFENELGKLNQLIERLLTLSRLESSTVLLREAPFDLADLAQDVISDVQFEASARECSIEIPCSEKSPVTGDQVLIRSAIENILRNAVQYSEEGTAIRVEVACSPPHATITVTDTGPGVSPSEMSQLFQPFFRGGEARSRRSDGYGLGLAITSRAITLHGGTIRAQNTGSGFEVCVRLPLTPVPEIRIQN
jgi:two-component system sensor histidine kinase CpxA